MPDIPVAGSDPGAYDPHMEERLARLEDDSREVKASLWRLEPMVERLSRLEPMVERLVGLVEATLPHLATKAELADLRTDMHDRYTSLRIEMNERFNQVDARLAENAAALSRTESNLRNEITAGDTRLHNEIVAVGARLHDEIVVGDGKLHNEIVEVRLQLMDKPSKSYMWGVLGVLIATFALALAGVAVIH